MGSPFTVQVQPGPTSAVHSLITGTGLQYAEAGVEGVFFVTLRDAQLNERRTSIGEPVTLDDARMSCADQGLGVYRCSYLITQARLTMNEKGFLRGADAECDPAGEWATREPGGAAFLCAAWRMALAFMPIFFMLLACFEGW